MKKKLGILLIRGSGASGFKRQEGFIKKVLKRLDKSGIDTTQIAYKHIDWYSHLQSRQEEIIKRLKASNYKLKSWPTRKLILTNIDDLITYGGKPNLPSKTYEKTHELVHKSIVKIKDELQENAPLVIIASSMGTEIINNYIWDLQKGISLPLYGKTAFERLETLVGLFTFGHNLPIFASSHNIDSLQPIAFPHQNLAPYLKTQAVWENYFDKNDSMGFPIKMINSNYKNAAVHDIQVNVGNLLSFWNLLSHFGYWKSKKLIVRISNFIKEIMDAI